MGPERSRRVQVIVLHRRFVRLASLAVPGAGVLWAGKEFRALVGGILLSLSLAAVTCSFGGLSGTPIIADLQKTVAVWSVAVATFIWIVFAFSGISSFKVTQQIHNISTERG